MTPNHRHYHPYHPLIPFRKGPQRYNYAVWNPNTETWRYIPRTFTGHSAYEVSTDGRVRRITFRSCTYEGPYRSEYRRKNPQGGGVRGVRQLHDVLPEIIPQTVDGGYHFALVKRVRSGDDGGLRKNMPVHVLVARAFLGVPKKRWVVVHRNGDTSDNSVHNMLVKMVTKYLPRYRLTNKAQKTRVLREKQRRALQFWIDGKSEKHITKRLDIQKRTLELVLTGVTNIRPFEEFCETVRTLTTQGWSNECIAEFLRVGEMVIERALKSLTMSPVRIHRDVQNYVNMVESDYESSVNTFLKVPSAILEKYRKTAYRKRSFRTPTTTSVSYSHSASQVMRGVI
jgi:hypothetical protein